MELTHRGALEYEDGAEDGAETRNRDWVESVMNNQLIEADREILDGDLALRKHI